MRFTVRCVVALGLFGLAIAGCSDKSEPTASGNGEEGLGAGGKGAGGKGAGGKATGSGGAPAMMCDADTKGDGCRKCLAGACCSTYTDCVGNAGCNKAFDDQAACVAVPGAEISSCFGDLTRAVMASGSSEEFPPILDCFIRNCSSVCGGPGAV